MSTRNSLLMHEIINDFFPRGHTTFIDRTLEETQICIVVKHLLVVVVDNSGEPRQWGRREGGERGEVGGLVRGRSRVMPPHLCKGPVGNEFTSCKSEPCLQRVKQPMCLVPAPHICSSSADSLRSSHPLTAVETPEHKRKVCCPRYAA